MCPALRPPHKRIGVGLLRATLEIVARLLLGFECFVSRDDIRFGKGTKGAAELSDLRRVSEGRHERTKTFEFAADLPERARGSG
jgi:hypothetical protein